jgi:hypothetical protein
MIADVLAIALIFGGGTLFLLAVSPIGRAVAERIRRGGGSGQGPAESGAQEALLDEIHELRREMGELAERVDFMERLQAKPRDAERLAPPR